MIELSVIIPTHNRAEILEKCLQHLHNSQFPKNKFEIIIIDDASTDNTQQVVEKAKETNPNINYFKQKKAGQGVARNFGVTQAKGNVCVLIGDDMFVHKRFLEEHFRIHKLNPNENYACLGLILWDPDIKISSFMKWLTQDNLFLGRFGGHQFAYNKLENKKFADYNFFYTSNLSIKTELLKKHSFDPWFDSYGWEDIELGYRLHKKEDLKIIYNPEAITYHHHQISYDSFKDRMISIGKGAIKFQSKHQELNVVPKGFKILAFKLISNPITIALLKLSSKLSQGKTEALYFYALSKKYFLIGLKQQIS
jgi:glycosyltransferase involved in cell wall biosynthesis